MMLGTTHLSTGSGRSLTAESTGVDASNSDHAAELISGTVAGVGTEPGDEAVNGEGLWEL